ncbi:AMP-binding protein [Paraburkholderia caledonica]|uniref:Amino acid adenylation domain-containing protein n=1 Tax=Paraburkholderia caledonica TaxID=134536 RepID=A0AB73IHY6_9BURK|nr:amino acid adenylation domain-containing protein [Paraburkholderia caledonica]
MTLASFSLQQLQAYSPSSTGLHQPEVLCTAFVLSHPIDLDALRRAACETLAQAGIALPDAGHAIACTVLTSDAHTRDDACVRALEGLIGRGDLCGFELAVSGDGVWLVAVALSWVFDAQGLARFVTLALERLTGGTTPDDTNNASYADYVDWQRKLAASPEAQFGKQYWTRCAGQFRPFVDLLLEERLDVVAPAAAAFGLRALPDTLARQLQAYATRYGVASKAIVLAAWLVVLERLRPEQRKDIVVAMSGRDDEVFGCLVGRLALELPLSLRIAGRAPFVSLVKHVAECLEEADEWKECYGEQHLSIDAKRNGVRFSTRTLQHGQAPGLSWCEVPCAPSNPSSRLELSFIEGADATLALYGDPTRYAATTIGFLLDQCETVLTRALADASATVNALIADDPANGTERVDARSTVECPVEGARLAAHDPAREPIGLRIEAACAQHPDSIAIRHGADSLTYAAFAHRVDAYRIVLAQSGVGVEAAVGIATDDPITYLVAAVAAWRVGAHFVALAADLPRARIDEIVKRTGVRAIVNADGTVHTLDFTDAQTLPRAEPPLLTGAVRRTALLDALAYVIFTSGTSGEPRAIAMSHRALANQLRALSRRLPIAAGAVALVRTPATFDASLWEWMHPLAHGATLHVLDTGDAFSEAALVDLMRTRPIALAQMTPSLLSRCLRVGGADALARVEHLVVGGEPLDAALATPIVSRMGRLVNAYGPAETCINASLHLVTSDRYLRTVPIGTPLDGYAFHILDQALRPVSVGRTGMLCIGGEGLARGLVGAPGATAASFLPDPFSGTPSGRIYVTGDLVRRLPNGDIEFVRRADHQLKLNGVRIDSAEVVAAITAEPSVKDAALVMVDDPSPALVACVVPKSVNHFSTDTLRAALRMKLPSSMCPAKFVVLEALPLDRHGKLDRRALHERAATAIDVAYVAPRTETERRVAQCWCAVLDVERVGVHDNFFLNGGHSLSFGWLIVALRETFGIQLPLSSVISAPSVAALAARIDALRDEENGVAPA